MREHQVAADCPSIAPKCVYRRIRLPTAFESTQGRLIHAGSLCDFRERKPGGDSSRFQFMNQYFHSKKRPCFYRSFMIAAGVQFFQSWRMFEFFANGFVPSAIRAAPFWLSF